MNIVQFKKKNQQKMMISEAKNGWANSQEFGPLEKSVSIAFLVTEIHTHIHITFKLIEKKILNF